MRRFPESKNGLKRRSKPNSKIIRTQILRFSALNLVIKQTKRDQKTKLRSLEPKLVIQ